MRRSLTAFAVMGLGLFRDPGCGSVDDPHGGTNAPCTRSSDCGGKLVCLEGVCRERDAGEPGDAAPPPPDGGDGGDDGG